MCRLEKKMVEVTMILFIFIVMYFNGNSKYIYDINEFYNMLIYYVFF